MKTKRLIIRVSGRVQGVWFRKSTQDEANRLGIKGLVKNMPDGSVYIEAEGDPEKLFDFTNWCKKGPSQAQVDDIKMTEEAPKNFSSFEITY